jgi:hypothetical protein
LENSRLIEVIEDQTARLSPEAKELWEQLELLRESVPDPADESRMAGEYEIMERIFELPVHEQFITSQLAELVGGLRAAEEGVGGGASGSQRDQSRLTQGPPRRSDHRLTHDAGGSYRPAEGVRLTPLSTQGLEGVPLGRLQAASLLGLPFSRQPLS